MGIYLLVGAAPRRVGGDVMGRHPRRARLWTALIVLFLLVPIALICLYAFNPSNIQSWPLDGPLDEVVLLDCTTRTMRDALWLSRAGRR